MDVDTCFPDAGLVQFVNISERMLDFLHRISSLPHEATLTAIDTLYRHRSDVHSECCPLPGLWLGLHRTMRRKKLRSEPRPSGSWTSPGTSSLFSYPSKNLRSSQALSPLFVIMRVAQNRFWPKPDNGLTTDAELTTKTRIRPALTLKLDFELPKHDHDEDDEDSSSTSRPPSSSLRFNLPSPLPSAKVRKEVVPMDVESARRCSHPPRYTLSQEDMLVVPLLVC